jgi:hypothetical protein
VDTETAAATATTAMRRSMWGSWGRWIPEQRWQARSILAPATH